MIDFEPDLHSSQQKAVRMKSVRGLRYRRGGKNCMKLRSRFALTALALIIAFMLSVPVAAQQARYRLIDLGTFGGPASYFSNGFDGILNNHGAAAGWANTSTPDSFCFAAPNCFATHAFLAQSGSMTDLGVLDG